ncbi:MAG TPA: ISAzo13 family transposase [Streptosporangiaceae bacterium]|nr:ISAzo13 family transposase [Streptosporangiaceae bacterium]
MGADAGFLGRLGPELARLLPMLDERSRRLAMGMAAAAAGEGGTAAVAALTGASWQTVADGKAELESGENAAAGRVRRPGGGRKLLEDADPGLLPALESLIRDAIRGDPMTPLLWTTRSLGHLSGELTAAGHPCSPAGLRLVMRRAGYTLQSNARAQEGRQHPERDGQFRHIAARSAEYLASGDPVISVDAKKKELVGNFGQDGREWGPAGEPVLARDHDFPDKDQEHAIPYGIYDEKGNAGFVNVGTGGNTAALAVESIRRWWNLAGKDAYPDAGRLLVTCDAGGSNGYANTAWRAGLADLAAETGLEIEVCHFPPGTSKWNKIEHRLFCQITLAWRGRPLTSYDVIISTIGNVTTRTGLTVRAVLDHNAHPAGAKPGSGRLRDIEDRYLTRGQWHGEWNYTLHPAPVRDAPPPPEPARAPAPRLASRDALNHPALTGADPAAVSALAAALAIPHAARRDRDNHIRRGGKLTGTPGSGRKARNGPADYLQALLIRRHLAVPNPVLAALLGTHKDVLSRQLTRTSALLAAAGLTLPPAAQPPPPPVRALDSLRDYAARHGITINAPPPAADKPPDTTLTTPTCRKLTLFLNMPQVHVVVTTTWLSLGPRTPVSSCTG